MTVEIILAFASEDPLRQTAFEKTRAHLEQLGWPIRIATDKHQPFRRGTAINKAAKRSQADIIAIHDADLICPHDQIREAVEMAEEAPGPVFAFTTYVRVGEPGGTKRLLIDAPSNGCVAIRRDCFLAIGGYDERFIGWAPDDRDFNDRASAIWPLRRVPGQIEHLWHGDRRTDDSTLDTPAELVAANWRIYESGQTAA